MEIKIGPKPDPCGMPLVKWVVFILEPDNKAKSQSLFYFRVKDSAFINSNKQISHWASESQSRKRSELEWSTDGGGKVKALDAESCFSVEDQKSCVHTWCGDSLRPRLSSPHFLFLSFLALNAVFYMMDLSIFSLSFQVAENIIHMLRCLASYCIRWDVRACSISTYMAQEHTTVQPADVRILVQAASLFSEFS